MTRPLHRSGDADGRRCIWSFRDTALGLVQRAMGDFERPWVLYAWLVCLTVAGSARAEDTPPPTRAFPPVAESSKPNSLDPPTAVPGPAPGPPPNAVVAPPAAGSGNRNAPTGYSPWFPPGGYYAPRNPDRPAPEQEEQPNRWDRNNLLEVHLGLGTPYGFLGVAYEHDLARYFGFVVGGGMGAEGGQAAASVRARIPFLSMALSFELSWSGGPYEWRSCKACYLGDYDTKRWDFAHWVNVSPAIELRAATGFNAHFYMGLGEPLNQRDVCVEARRSEIDCSGSKPTLFFLGLSLGAAL